MDILSAIKGKVKIKLSLSPLVDSIIDDVLEPSIDKVVADTKNPFDNMLKASVYPSLEKEIKEKAKEVVKGLKDKLPESIKDFVEIE